MSSTSSYQAQTSRSAARIYYGRVTADAAHVTDLVSGRGASVIDGGLFILAVPDPDPMHVNALGISSRSEPPGASLPTIANCH